MSELHNVSSAAEAAELRERLREAEETLDAIRNGDVDAVVVGGPSGQQVYTLENADRPYRVLIEQMQEGAVTLAENGTVLYCNQRFATIVGTSREAIIGTRVQLLLAETDIDAFTHLLAQQEGARSIEVTLHAASAPDVPVNISVIDLEVEANAPRVICAVITDLTRSHQRSHELAAANASLAGEIDERRRTEERLEVALDAAGMGSWDIDLIDGRARRSARYDEIFGLSNVPDDLGLDEMLLHFLAEDRTPIAAAFERAKAVGSIEFEMRTRRVDDDQIRWVHVKGRTHYQAGRAVRVAGVVSDITDRRMVDQQLRQAQKMEAIGQLTGGIAHDFNNLLMVIGGSLDMLEAAVPRDERSQRYFSAARHGVERGATLNQQLLAFSRRQDLRVEAVCADELIRTFESLLDRAVGETIIVNLLPAAARWCCLTDPHQLETAILNLAINARDAMPGGGNLTLSTEMRTINARSARVFGADAGRYVAVLVRDTGVGMAPDTVTRIFEPFFTTKAVGKGTGLGLSQVYGFAQQSGGFVTVESELGNGTLFTIFLPETDDNGHQAPVHTASGEVQGQGVVLVVEDDEHVRDIATSMLSELGYSVLRAASGRAALQVIDSGAAVDLVFSDVIMAGDIGGMELVHELRARFPHMALLLTSGYTAQQFAMEDVAKGIELLKKPYTRAALSAAVNAALGQGKQP